MRLVAILLGSILLVQTSCAEKTESPGRSPGIENHPGVKDLHRFVEAQRLRYGWPALGVGVIYRGKILALGMSGERHVGTGDWACVDDRFNVGSCAKSMAAVVAAKLVEEGKLAWDARAADLLPEAYENARLEYANVTLEQLLGHRAGLDQWMKSNETWTGWHRDRAGMSATDKRLSFASAALRRPPKYPPGTQHYYCNDGYLIAGSMIEKAAGQPFEELVQEWIFQPLKLDSAGYGPGTVDRRGAVAWGHERTASGSIRDMKPDPAEYGESPFGAPAGFLYCSVPDLLQYVDEHARGANCRGRLLKRESYDRLHMPLEGQQYALGWEVETTRDEMGRVLERSVYHGGYTGRDRANMWFCPETGWGTVIVCNDGEGYGVEMGQVFHELLLEAGIVKAISAKRVSR